MTDTATCANCGAPTTGAYCAACGEEADARTPSFVGWVREVLSELFSLDGRTARTARDLLRPGRLSEDWAAGRRARHLTPLRVFLLASVVFFSVAFLLGPVSPQEGARAFNDDAVAAVARRTATEIVVLSVPVVALTLALVLFRKRRWLLEHVVFALHAVAVALLVMAAAWAFAHLLPARLGGLALLAGLVVTFVWLGLAIARFYRVGLAPATGVALATLLALGLAARPFASFADARLREYDERRDDATRVRALVAHDAALRADVPAELRRAAAAQSFAAYLELDQREALTAEDRPRFACVALELGMPGQAATIDSATVGGGCPAGL